MNTTLSRMLIGASLLVLGGAVGIALDRTIHSAGGMHGHLADPTHLTTDAHRAAAMEQLHRVLHLDSAQARQIEATIRAHQSTVEEGWTRIQTNLHAAVDSVHEHLRTVLTPEQWERFVAWTAEWHGELPPAR